MLHRDPPSKEGPPQRASRLGAPSRLALPAAAPRRQCTGWRAVNLAGNRSRKDPRRSPPLSSPGGEVRGVGDAAGARKATEAGQAWACPTPMLT
eukprot:5831344-Alexandrium_andersonii.AAC.1